MGGLAAAIRLQSAGVQVTLFERSSWLGGKLRHVDVGGRPVAAGPTVMTMPWVFEELLAAAGTSLRERLRLTAIEPACRHFFVDGSRLDLFQDEARSRDAVHAFAGADAVRQLDAFRARAATIYEAVHGPFMEQALPSSLMFFLNPMNAFSMAPRLLKIDAMRTLWKSLGATFTDERLRVLFGRYATYNGSSPFHAPATLAVIPHVELAFGIHAVEGGIVHLAEVLAEVARERGAALHTDAEVERILVEPQGRRRRVCGVVVAGERIEADVVIANCDVLHLYDKLLADEPGAREQARRVEALEPSLSAFLMLAVAPVGDFPLVHHNVFFSGDYKREFDELIEARRPPEEPTVYLCAQDRIGPVAPAADGVHAAGERHLLLTNAPAVAGPDPVDWAAESAPCRARLVAMLQRHGLAFSPTAQKLVTPADLARIFPSSRGSIYGQSSNSLFAAFERPPNRVRRFPGLFCVGGSAHPGAGLPMVALSARIATEQVFAHLGLKQEKKEEP